MGFRFLIYRLLANAYSYEANASRVSVGRLENADATSTLHHLGSAKNTAVFLLWNSSTLAFYQDFWTFLLFHSYLDNFQVRCLWYSIWRRPNCLLKNFIQSIRFPMTTTAFYYTTSILSLSTLVCIIRGGKRTKTLSSQASHRLRLKLLNSKRYILLWYRHYNGSIIAKSFLLETTDYISRRKWRPHICLCAETKSIHSRGNQCSAN